jgi:hypothetical protein
MHESKKLHIAVEKYRVFSFAFSFSSRRTAPGDRAPGIAGAGKIIAPASRRNLHKLLAR